MRKRIISVGSLIAFVVAGGGFVAGYWSMTVPSVVILGFLFFKVYGSLFIASNFYIRTFCKGDRNGGSIAITFDDGPEPENTVRILKILKEKNVKATFFCIGKKVRDAKSLVRQINEEGHLIGNHSFNHGKWFDLQSAQKMREELKMTDDAIALAISKKPKLFRPPYGVTNPNLAAAVRDDYQAIGWSIRSYDTVSSDKDKLWKRVTKKLKGGDVVLFHDRCEATIEMLPRFIDHVSEVGLRIVPLDQMLNVKPYA
ncbi:MAG TPA: polysaccharide deacetylase family protein [Cyclobacteriaceae bacterium]|nr:polysaccharide deacetylase family protein [Cyclobacteriaceae bacterium]